MSGFGIPSRKHLVTDLLLLIDIVWDCSDVFGETPRIEEGKGGSGVSGGGPSGGRAEVVRLMRCSSSAILSIILMFAVSSSSLTLSNAAFALPSSAIWR